MSTSDGEDRISGLPDELLHSILLRLPDTAAAARATCVLSRRWCRVWAHLPELRLVHDDASAQTQARVDGALDAYAASSVSHLCIVVNDKLPRLSKRKRDPDQGLDLPRPLQFPRVAGHRVSAWLRFASLRLTGSLRIAVPSRIDGSRNDEQEHQILLPLSDKMKSVSLKLSYHMLRLQAPPLPGACTALLSLTIENADMDIGELECVVSSRCPSLTALSLVRVGLHGPQPHLAIRSDSLQQLRVDLRKHSELKLIQVTAPVLSEVHWYGCDSHHFTENATKTHLQRLEIVTHREGMALMRRFHTVHELILKIAVYRVMNDRDTFYKIFLLLGVESYKSFLSGISKLPRCEILVIEVDLFYWVGHPLKPILLCLLRKCAGVRKIVLEISSHLPVCEASGCPCHLPENCEIDDIVLGSLEQVEVDVCFGDDRKIELIKLLYQLSDTSREKVTITVSRGRASANIHEKIQRICPRNNKVQITVKE